MGDRNNEGDDRDLSKWYDLECSCGWTDEASSYGGAESDAMAHEDNVHGLNHTVKIKRQSDGKVLHP